MGKLLSLSPGDGDKLLLITGEDAWVLISLNVKLFLISVEGSGEGLLVPVFAGDTGLSKTGEALVFVNSGEAALSTGSGDVAIEMTGEGGVYRGLGVEKVLCGSDDNLVSRLSGVVVVSLPAEKGSGISTGV